MKRCTACLPLFSENGRQDCGSWAMCRMCGLVPAVALSWCEPALSLQRPAGGKVHRVQSHQADTHRWALQLASIRRVYHINQDIKQMCILLDVTCIHGFSPWSDSAGGLGGYEILKVHDADPFLGVEVKFVDVAACQQFLESYSSGAVRQSLSQHACRLLALPEELTVETQLKAGTHILDLYLDKLELCLQHIHLSQVDWMFLFVCSLVIWDGAPVF